MTPTNWKINNRGRCKSLPGFYVPADVIGPYRRVFTPESAGSIPAWDAMSWTVEYKSSIDPGVYGWEVVKAPSSYLAEVRFAMTDKYEAGMYVTRVVRNGD